MNPKNKSLLLLSISTVLASFTGLLARLMTTPVVWLIFSRMLIAAIALAFILKLKGIPFKLKNKKEFYLLVGLGFILAYHWLAVFKAFQLSSVAVGITAIFTFPVLTALMEPWVLKTPFRFVDLLCACIAFVGVFLTTPEFDLSNHYFQGVLWGLFAAFTFACRNLLIKKNIHGIGGIKMMFYQCLIGACFLIPLLGEFPIENIFLEWKELLILGVVLTAVTHTLYIVSMKSLSASSTSVISSLQVAYAIVLAYLILDEKISLQVAFGSAILLSVVIFESFRKSKK